MKYNLVIYAKNNAMYYKYNIIHQIQNIYIYY